MGYFPLEYFNLFSVLGEKKMEVERTTGRSANEMGLFQPMYSMGQKLDFFRSVNTLRLKIYIKQSTKYESVAKL